MEHAVFRLPGGYVDPEGVVHREVELAPLGGREEDILARYEDGSRDAEAVTAVIGRCLRSLGAAGPGSAELARRLLVGDRQYLLLKLREITFGKEIRAVIRCPSQECRQRIDIDFSSDDIPVRELRDKGPLYRLALSPKAAGGGGKDREVCFRLPNGADQEALTPLLARNEARVAALLLERCLQGPDAGSAAPNPASLSALARMEIEARMEALAPGPELVMGASCPECGRDFSLPFDLQTFFLRELRTTQDLLFREVHYLAFHYHWSEAEILAMPRARRRKYIEILADEMKRARA